MKKILIIFLLVILPLQSQEKGKQKVYTLQECLQIAREQNPQIKIAESDIATSGAELTSAFGNYLPNLSFNMGYTRQLNVEEGQKINIGGQTILVGKIEPNSYNMSFSANLNLFDGFSREATYSQAKENLNSAFSSYSQTLNDVSINVYRSYINVIRAEKVLLARRQNFEAGKKELERIQAYYEAGSVPITNLLSQEADLSAKEIEIIQAENDLNNAKANLMIAIGLNPETDYLVSDSELPKDITKESIANFRRELGDLESLANKAFKNRFDYLALNQKISSAQSSLTIARSGYIPTLSAYGGWSWANNEFNKFSDLGRTYLGLSLRIPVFENFRTNYQLELAKAQILRLDMQKIQLEQTIRSEIIRSLNNFETAVKQLDATERSYFASQKNFESAKERYQVGSIGITDYILANNMYINSEINRINAIYNYFVAQKEIYYVLGLIDTK